MATFTISNIQDGDIIEAETQNKQEQQIFRNMQDIASVKQKAVVQMFDDNNGNCWISNFED